MLASLVSINEEKYKNLLVLKNDNDFADVIMLYQTPKDVMYDPDGVHYIKTPDYNGYVGCLKNNCPACAKGIRNQKQIFIPVYNVNTGEFLFFNRPWNPYLESDIDNLFKKYTNPSEFVIRITRHGATGDRQTKYEFTAIAKNTVISYDEILAKCNIKFPDVFENVCKSMSSGEMYSALNATNNVYANNSANAVSSVPYQITPRAAMPTVSIDQIANMSAAIDSVPELDSSDEMSFDTATDDVDFN